MRIEIQSWQVGNYFFLPGPGVGILPESNSREMGPSFFPKEKASERRETCCLPARSSMVVVATGPFTKHDLVSSQKGEFLISQTRLTH